MKRIHKTIIIAGVLITLSLLSLAVILKPTAEQKKQYTPELNLNTSDTWDFYAQPPYLSVAPSDMHYSITRAIEQIQSLSGEKARILSMRKRAAELVNWGSAMDTTIDVNYNSISSLLHWWNENKNAPKHYNSWQAELAQYAVGCSGIIHQHPVSQSGAEFYQSMMRMIREDQVQLNEIINNKDQKIHDREHILTLSNTVFDYCINQIERRGFVTDPFVTNYQIGDDDVFIKGKYSAFLSEPEPSYSKTASIQSSMTTVRFRKNSKNSNLFNTKEQFAVGESDIFVHAKIPTSNLAEKNENVKIQSDDTTTHVTADIEIPDTIHTSEFLVRIHLPRNSTDLLIQKQSLAMDTSQNAFIPYTFSYPRIVPDTSNTYTEVLYGSHGEVTKSVSIQLTIPISESKPLIELYPLYHPPLTLVGHGYQLTHQTPPFLQSRSQLKLILYAILLISLGLIFVAVRQKFTVLRRAALNNEVAILIYLPLFTVCYVLDIFLYPKNISIYPILLLEYLFILYSLYPSIQLLIKVLASQFAIGFFFFLTRQDTYSEPIFRWVTLQIPVILVYAYSPTPTEYKQKNYKEFWFYKTITTLFHILKICTLAVVNKLFTLSPRNPRDIMRNVFVATILLVMVILTHIAYQKIVYIKSNFDRIPVVDVYEPKIVYKSNFVLLKGRHFGWNEDGHSYLSTDKGKIKSTVWTENEIIFQIPLWLSESQIPITVVKNDEWFGTNKNLMSKPFTLSVISRTDGWGPEDDNYFKQLDSMSEKARKLNGYQ